MVGSTCFDHRRDINLHEFFCAAFRKPHIHIQGVEERSLIELEKNPTATWKQKFGSLPSSGWITNSVEPSHDPSKRPDNFANNRRATVHHTTARVPRYRTSPSPTRGYQTKLDDTVE